MNANYKISILGVLAFAVMASFAGEESCTITSEHPANTLVSEHPVSEHPVMIARSEKKESDHPVAEHPKMEEKKVTQCILPEGESDHSKCEHFKAEKKSNHSEHPTADKGGN